MGEAGFWDNQDAAKGVVSEMKMIKALVDPDPAEINHGQQCGHMGRARLQQFRTIELQAEKHDRAMARALLSNVWPVFHSISTAYPHGRFSG